MTWLERSGKCAQPSLPNSLGVGETERCLSHFNSVLCNDFAIKLIEEPFVSDSDNRNEWAL